MAKNKITDLRDHLFFVIEALRANTDPQASPEEKMDVATASAITKAAHVIVESTKMEIEVVRIMAKSGKVSSEEIAKQFKFANLEITEQNPEKPVIAKSKFDNNG